MAFAFGADGTMLAADIDFVSDCGAYRCRGRWSGGRGRCRSLPLSPPAAAFSTKTVYTNTVGRTAYRGPWQFETLAREVLLDIAAREMAIDPVELRRRNLIRQDELPFTNPNGMAYDSISPVETFEQALSMLDYGAFRAEQAEARAAGRYLGVGVSNYVEPSTPGNGYYAHRGGDDPHRALGQGERLHRRRFVREQPRGHRHPADRRSTGRAGRGRRHDPGRHCRHGLRRRGAGSRSASMTAGAVREDDGDPARADRQDRRPQAGGAPEEDIASTVGRATAGRPRSA